ncbi:hypothetical protein DOE78_22985 [Bacillus sp. Y1]|jgi:teichuronic acid biosynthesis protein TuaF|nr:hypothetical protein [Bacillus sp. Y1]AYA78032.1 hypothetical protein DOE78_22985 [Bacillus sp. Y1]
MNTIVKQVVARIRKLLILLLLIPILTMGISYFMEAKAPSTYTATATVLLGNFQNERITNQDWMETSMSTGFLEKLKIRSNSDYDVNEIKGRLSVSKVGKGSIKFQYSGESAEEAEATLTDILDGFLAISNDVYEPKKKLVDSLLQQVNTSDKIEDIEVNFEAIDSIGEVGQLGLTSVDLAPTEIVEPIQVATSYNDPVKRAVFGLLLGIMLDIFLLAIPELFRDYTKA